MKFRNKVIVFTAAASLLMLAALSLGFNPAPSRADRNSLVEKTDTTVKIKKLHFTTWEEGERVHWKAVMRNGVLQELYKDGDKLSDDELNKYRDMVYDRTRHHHFDFDSFDADVPDINIHFDPDKFDLQMDQLRANLRNMKLPKYDFRFNRDEFREQMKKMRKDLRVLKDCDFFDEDAFEKAMEQVKINLDNFPDKIQVDIDTDALAKSMENVKIHMKDIKIDMSKLRVKLKQLKEFMIDVRSELVKDGYLNDEDEDFDMDFSKDKLEINGHRLPDNLLKKYKDIYKEHFGKEISNNFRISN